MAELGSENGNGNEPLGTDESGIKKTFPLISFGKIFVH